MDIFSAVNDALIGPIVGAFIKEVCKRTNSHISVREGVVSMGRSHGPYMYLNTKSKWKLWKRRHVLKFLITFKDSMIDFTLCENPILPLRDEDRVVAVNLDNPGSVEKVIDVVNHIRDMDPLFEYTTIR